MVGLGGHAWHGLRAGSFTLASADTLSISDIRYGDENKAQNTPLPTMVAGLVLLGGIIWDNLKIGSFSWISTAKLSFSAIHTGAVSIR